MRFEFATATRIVFGVGTVREVPAAAAQMGRRALVVARRSARVEAIGITGVAFPVHGEPTVDLVRTGTQLAREAACDMVIALGGGSAIDAGKAIAALLANGGDPLDYLEVVGQGRPLTRPSAPFIAIPTTAGTGSEVTRNAVLASPEHRVKASLRSPHMLPALAIVDPELTLDLPPALTASTGLDALTQLIEPYVSCRANPMTDLYCVEGLTRAASALRRVFRDGHDLAARTDMAFASLLGGLALANAGLGAVHGFAAPLGGMFDAPHGALCAALLPHAMRVNIAALRTADRTADRYARVARILTGHAGRHAGRRRGLGGHAVRRSGNPAVARLRCAASRCARAGGEGRPRQQHESQSHRAHAAANWRNCSPVPSDQHPLIELERVWVMRGEKIVLRDVSLRIGVGEHVAILGPNGCGKSTLIKTIMRECYPLVREGSRMAIFGQERWNIFDLRPLLGVVSNDWMTLVHARDHGPRGGALRLFRQRRRAALSSRSRRKSSARPPKSWRCWRFRTWRNARLRKCRPARRGACCWRARWCTIHARWCSMSPATAWMSSRSTNSAKSCASWRARASESSW